MGHDTKQEFTVLSLILLPIYSYTGYGDCHASTISVQWGDLHQSTEQDRHIWRPRSCCWSPHYHWQNTIWEERVSGINEICIALVLCYNRDTYQDKNNYLFHPGSQCTKQLELYKLVRWRNRYCASECKLASSVVATAELFRSKLIDSNSYSLTCRSHPPHDS